MKYMIGKCFLQSTNKLLKNLINMCMVCFLNDTHFIRVSHHESYCYYLCLLLDI